MEVIGNEHRVSTLRLPAGVAYALDPRDRNPVAGSMLPSFPPPVPSPCSQEAVQLFVDSHQQLALG